MISGTCLTLSNLAPKMKIYAAEPDQADDAARSFRAGHIIADDAPVTIADGLKVPLKENTWHFVSHFVTDVLTASEQEIIDAMKLTWEQDEDRDGAKLCCADGHDPAQPGGVSGQARGRCHHGWECRFG